MIIIDIFTNSLKYTFFLFLSHYLWFLVSPIILKDTLIALKTDRKKFSFVWRSVSSFHATVMFSFSVYYWFYLSKFNFREVGNLSAHQIITIDLMIGFLWYDTIVELMQTRQIDSLMHHLFGMVSHFSTRLSNNHATGYYTMMVYLAEGSTPWLNICWLCFNANYMGSLLERIGSFNLLLTFFFFRVCMPTYMTWHFNTYANEWDWKSERYVWQLFILNYIVVLFFTILNYYWFYKLVKLAYGDKKVIEKEDKII